MDEEEVDRDEGAVKQDGGVEGESEFEHGFDRDEVFQEWNHEHVVISQEAQKLTGGALPERLQQSIDESQRAALENAAVEH